MKVKDQITYRRKLPNVYGGGVNFVKTGNPHVTDILLLNTHGH